MATDTMAEFMGVRVDPVDEAPQGDFAQADGDVARSGTVDGRRGGYVLDGRLNDASGR